MSTSRFNGVMRNKNETGHLENKHVLILSPYVQTSETDIDYNVALVVDLQYQENEVVAQLEEMMKSAEANASKTFLEYSQYAQFKNGENVMRWLHDHKAILRKSVDDVDIVMNNQSMNLRSVNSEIARQNGHSMQNSEQSAQSVASEFTDSSMNETNTRPALIDGGERSDYVEPTTGTEHLSEDRKMEQEALQALQKEKTVPIPENPDSAEIMPYDPVGGPHEATDNQLRDMMDRVLNRLDGIESKVKSNKDKETVMMKLVNRYDLTEQELVKAIESAGNRKQKRKEKQDKDAK